MKPGRIALISFGFILFINFCCAQPYIDIGHLKYQTSPDAGIWRRDFHQNKFTFGGAAFNIPIQFKKDSSILIISPATEYWDITIDNTEVKQRSLIIPMAYVKPLSQNWNLLLTGMLRWNGYSGNLFYKSVQAGGAVIATYKKNRDRQLKFGAYYNSEFSGPFFIPLAGIDWKIDNKNNLFGVLPGSLIYEHKLNDHFYWGLIFKAITTSFIDKSSASNSSQDFIRIDDNQLGIYLDTYVNRKIVITTSVGHSALRKFRFGTKHDSEKYYYKEPMNDDLIFELGLSYRLRLR
jgi:hypothetical protein